MNDKTIDDSLARFYAAAGQLLRTATAIADLPAKPLPRPPKRIPKADAVAWRLNREHWRHASESQLAEWRAANPVLSDGAGANVLAMLESFYDAGDEAFKGASDIDVDLKADIIALRDVIGPRGNVLLQRNGDGTAVREDWALTRFIMVVRDPSQFGSDEIKNCVSRLRRHLAVIAAKSGRDMPAAGLSTDDGMRPADHYKVKYGIPTARLDKARRDGRLHGDKRCGRWYYQLAAVRHLWPQDITD